MLVEEVVLEEQCLWRGREETVLEASSGADPVVLLEEGQLQEQTSALEVAVEQTVDRGEAAEQTVVVLVEELLEPS